MQQLLNCLTRSRAVPKPIARIVSKGVAQIGCVLMLVPAQQFYCLVLVRRTQFYQHPSMATSPIKKDGDTCIKISRRTARKGANTETRTCG